MNGVNGVNGPGNLQPIQPVHTHRAGQVPAQQPAARRDDTVEISDTANFMSRIAELPDVRQEKVAQVRAAIENGTYLTPDKLDVALDRLLAEL